MVILVSRPSPLPLRGDLETTVLAGAVTAHLQDRLLVLLTFDPGRASRPGGAWVFKDGRQEAHMRAIVVYESMFGGTLRIAEAVAAGLTSTFEVRVVRAADVEAGAFDGVDLIVVGGPTHAWSMSRPSTRKGAPDYARKPGSGLELEPGADISPGVREWLESVSELPSAAAAFDTRIAMPAVFTGRASKSIARGLSRRGARLLAPPESFLVDKRSHLLASETERARVWGAELASAYLRSVAKAG